MIFVVPMAVNSLSFPFFVPSVVLSPTTNKRLKKLLRGLPTSDLFDQSGIQVPPSNGPLVGSLMLPFVCTFMTGHTATGISYPLLISLWVDFYMRHLKHLGRFLGEATGLVLPKKRKLGVIGNIISTCTDKYFIKHFLSLV